MIAVQAINNDFAAKMQNQLSKEYLHYHSYKPINLNGASLERLWQSQKTLFAKRFNALNKTGGQGRNYNQIRNLLKNWNTEGEIGSSILAGLQDIALFDNNGQTTNYGTSGGISVGDFTVANARSAFNKSKKSAEESISLILDAVDNSINNIIRVLADNKEYLLAQAIIDVYASGGRTVPTDLHIPADTSLGSNLISVSNNKLIATIQTLQQNLNQLSALKGSTLKADAYKATYSEIVGSIRSSLNSIGGTMHEVGFTLAALQAAKKAEKMLQESNETIAQIVASNGGHFTANWTAQDTADESGAETKNDVTIRWNTGQAIIEFGGSIKLRQGQAFRGSGPGSEKLALGGLIVRNENLEQNLAKLEQYALGVTESAASMVAALESDGAEESWYQIKQRLGMLNLVDAIAGSGLQGDFSAILIVNNRIFTMPDILDNIGKTLTQIGSSSSIGKGYTVQGADLNKMQNQVRGQSEKFSEVGKQALSRNRNAWEILQNTKISISINLGYLFGTSVFK